MTQDDLVALAHAFRDATTEDLSTAEAPADFHRATRRAQQRLDQLFTAMTEEGRVPVACRAGCSFCCYLKVETRAHDVFALAAWIDEHFPPAERIALLERLRAHVARLDGLTIEQQISINFPCPLLRDGCCSAYAARPAACRVAHSTDVKPCEYAFQHSEDLDAPSGADEDVRLGMHVANDGVAWAFREAGYDEDLYHLSAALAEALTDPEAQPRWLARRAAFSSAALSRPEEAQDSSII